MAREGDRQRREIIFDINHFNYLVALNCAHCHLAVLLQENEQLVYKRGMKAKTQLVVLKA
jgi:hypothetical protein